ncbi:MAG: DUF3108 domain-containing protein [Pseudomonadota bacterium]
MLRPTLFLILSGFLLGKAVAPAASADEERMAYRFTLYLGGIRAAEMTLDARWSAASYEGRSTLRMVGLAKLLYAGSLSATGSGSMQARLFVPGTFSADSAFEGARQRVWLRYRDGRPAEVTADPPYRARAYQIAPAAQTGTLDPLAAALTLIRPEPIDGICNRSVDVFDGRRRIRLTLGAPVESHDGMRCPGTYTRMAGFAPKIMRKGANFPFWVVFRADAQGVAEIWQIFADTDFGRAVALRRG